MSGRSSPPNRKTITVNTWTVWNRHSLGLLHRDQCKTRASEGVLPSGFLYPSSDARSIVSTGAETTWAEAAVES